MIRDISTMTSDWLTVGSSGRMTPYISNPSAPMAGQVCWNNSRSRLEVFDGFTWHGIDGGSGSVNLTPRTMAVLAWAEQKMYEERALADRLERFPGLKDAYERFQIMDQLTRESRTNQEEEVQAAP